MNRPTVRVTLALLLLGGAPAAGSAAAGSVAARTAQTAPRMAQGARVNVKAIQDALPTLNLLIDVQLLSDLLARREITFGGPASREMRALLLPLLTRQELRPADAGRLEAALHTVLSPSEGQTLKQARAAAEARAQAFMARARFAATDGPLNLTLIRYGLMVPGGQDTVKLVVGQNCNPYAQAGMNADVLARLLALLNG